MNSSPDEVEHEKKVPAESVNRIRGTLLINEP
jgi:hypothetical protein